MENKELNTWVEPEDYQLWKDAFAVDWDKLEAEKEDK